MWRIIQSGNSIPMSFIVDPSCEFQAGSVAQLVVRGNTVVAGVSDGTAPIGIIDDNKTRAFSANSWNEQIDIPLPGITPVNGMYLTPYDIKTELKNAYIDASSFEATIPVILNATNGVITIPAGTQLNVDLTGSGSFSGIRLWANYSYRVANVPGDDSTLGSKRVTVWYDKIFFMTDQFETNQTYPVNAPLYVNERGLFTTRLPQADYPVVAIVTRPPGVLSAMVEALWL
jgi:hypothetical protein